MIGSGCKQSLDDYAVKCTGCQLDLLRNEIRPAELVAKSINRQDQSVFFYVSVKKLIVMSVVTFGIYNLLWFYKNWTYVREHTHRNLWPAIYAIFGPFTYYGLIQEVSKAGKAQGIVLNQSFGLFAAAYFVLNASWRLLPEPFSLIGLLAPLCFIPVQKYVNSLNATSPTPINDRFTVINWVAIVIGSVLLVLCIAGSLLPTSK